MLTPSSYYNSTLRTAAALGALGTLARRAARLWEVQQGKLVRRKGTDDRRCPTLVDLEEERRLLDLGVRARRADLWRSELVYDLGIPTNPSHKGTLLDERRARFAFLAFFGAPAARLRDVVLSVLFQSE